MLCRRPARKISVSSVLVLVPLPVFLLAFQNCGKPFQTVDLQSQFKNNSDSNSLPSNDPSLVPEDATGTSPPASTPPGAGNGEMANGAGVSKVVAGVSHTCALQAGGVKCWGNGQSIGDGENVQKFAPTPVMGLSSGVMDISSMIAYTCVVQNGGVRCWVITPLASLEMAVQI